MRLYVVDSDDALCQKDGMENSDSVGYTNVMLMHDDQ